MDYKREIKEAGYKGSYLKDDGPFIVTCISPKTYTGRNAFYLRQKVKEGMSLIDIRNMKFYELFPEIYLNDYLSIDEVQYLELIRNSELEMIKNGMMPQHHERYAWGYNMPDGCTICNPERLEDGIASDIGLNFIFTHEQMVSSSQNMNLPITLREELLTFDPISIKIYQYMQQYIK